MVRPLAMTQTVFLGLLFGTLLYAAFQGAAPERIGALIVASATIATIVVPKVGQITFARFEPNVFAVDLLMAIALILLALRAQRYWPIWAAALQIDTVVSHFAMLFAPRVMPWGYAVAEIAWSYPIVILLAAGVARHQQRKHAYGNDPSWSTNLH